MKTPPVIARDRARYEQMLAALDDDEQAWSELPADQQLAELFHEGVCSDNHYGECDFNKGDWADPNKTQAKYLLRMRTVIGLLPQVTDIETLAEALIIARKAL